MRFLPRRTGARFVALSEKHYDPTSGQQKSVRAIVGKDVKPVLLQAPDGTAVQAVPRKVLDKALRPEQPKPRAKPAATGHARENDDRIKRAVGAAVAEKWEATETLTPAFWRELADEALEMVDIDVFERRGWKMGNEAQLLSKMSVAEMRGLVAEILFRQKVDYRPLTEIVRTAKLLGVNAEPIIKREKEAIDAAAKAEKELAKAKAKKGKKGGADGAKKKPAASGSASKKKSAKKARAERRVRAGVCRVCGCTDEWGCDGGCEWVEPDLCSECVGEVT